MSERRFPIQGHTEDGPNGSRRQVPPMTVPWIVGEIAYNWYAERFGREQGEMDQQLPQWRELTALLDTPKGERIEGWAWHWDRGINFVTDPGFSELEGANPATLIIHGAEGGDDG